MKFLILFVLAGFSLGAAQPMIDFGQPKIGVQNMILAKVNGTTISMIDVKKKMDFIFHQHYEKYAGSSKATFQFYEASWRRVLMEMIDNELILADAADREIKVADAEVREEIERRFGPNVMSTLDEIGLTYDETWKLAKNEMIVQRMSWWFVQSKAITKVTPQEIRQSYRLFQKENPPYTELKYQTLTLRGDEEGALAQELYEKCSAAAGSPQELATFLKDFEAAHPGCSIQISEEHTTKDLDLTENYRKALVVLQERSYGKPALQTAKDKKKSYRIFYLAEKTQHETPSFDEMSTTIKNELLQKASQEVSQAYLDKLRKHYRFDPAHLEEALPGDLHPFALQ